MERIHGDSRTRSEGGEVESHMHIHTESAERARDSELEELAAGAKRRLDELADRAGSMAERLRDSARDRLDRAGATVDEHTGLIGLIRSRPLTALGVVFATGFLAGLASSPENHHWTVERARRRVRALIIGGVTAALAQELRSSLGIEGGLGELFATADNEEGLDLHEPEELDDLDQDDEFVT